MNPTGPVIGRRTTFTGLAALGAALVLAGCGGDETKGPDAVAGEVLTRTEEVPVGGGIILADKKIVVTQPTAGEYAAFSAVCTHQAATLSSVTEQGIHCPLHGSVFSAVDGSVVHAPATSPLRRIEVEVVGDEIRVV